MTISRLLRAGACVVALAAASAAAGRGDEAGERRVGEFGQPDRIVFEGIETFSRDEILAGLRGDLDFLLASHPEAPLAAYPNALAQVIARGYAHNGFPRVHIDVTASSAKRATLVEAREGPRYRNGEVRVWPPHCGRPVEARGPRAP
ncbi:MAG: hypothetical protein ACODAJ_04100, partial [Planctomycetota bacterium]